MQLDLCFLLALSRVLSDSEGQHEDGARAFLVLTSAILNSGLTEIGYQCRGLTWPLYLVAVISLVFLLRTVLPRQDIGFLSDDTAKYLVTIFAWSWSRTCLLKSGSGCMWLHFPGSEKGWQHWICEVPTKTMKNSSPWSQFQISGSSQWGSLYIAKLALFFNKIKQPEKLYFKFEFLILLYWYQCNLLIIYQNESFA